MKSSCLPPNLLSKIVCIALQSSSSAESGEVDNVAFASFQLINHLFRSIVTEAAEILHLNATLLGPCGHVLRCFPNLRKTIISTHTCFDESKQERSDIYGLSALAFSETTIKNITFVGSSKHQLHLWNFPDLLGKRMLESLTFTECVLHSLADGVSCLPIAVVLSPSHFRHLQNLDLTRINSLVELDLSQLDSLRTLNLTQNASLVVLELPLSSGKLTHLTVTENNKLSCISCRRAVHLKEASFHRNSTLSIIDMGACNRLANLFMTENTELDYLQLDGCNSLIRLIIADSPILQDVDVKSCLYLADIHLSSTKALSSLLLPTRLDFLVKVFIHNTGIVELNLCECNSLRCFTLSSNNKLERLRLEANPNLTFCHSAYNDVLFKIDLAANPSMTSLFVVHHPSLTELSLTACKGLKRVELRDLDQLNYLDFLSRLQKLETLQLKGLPNPELIDLSMSHQLKLLQVDDCIGIREVFVNSKKVQVFFNNCGHVNLESAR